MVALRRGVVAYQRGTPVVSGIIRRPVPRSPCRGTSLTHKKQPPHRWDHHRTLGTCSPYFVLNSRKGLKVKVLRIQSLGIIPACSHLLLGFSRVDHPLPPLQDLALPHSG